MEYMQLTAAQLRDAEDKLAQLRTEHEEALQSTEQELCNLRERCAVLEAEKQEEIDACATCPSMSNSPRERKAYLAGKTEGQREATSTNARIETLSRALELADRNALSANVQLMQLKVFSTSHF
jgi:hypothetical protein